jgi:hypothetical protein
VVNCLNEIVFIEKVHNFVGTNEGLIEQFYFYLSLLEFVYVVKNVREENCLVNSIPISRHYIRELPRKI